MNNQYDAIIQKYARADFPAKYLKGMIQVESGFRSDRTGPRGEIGLMQFLPSTAKDRGYTPDQLRDPETAIKAGGEYIGWILDKFVNPFIKVQTDPELRVRLAQLGYNAGIAFSKAAGQRFGNDPAIMGTAASWPGIIDYLRSLPVTAKMAKITGEKDFIGTRKMTVDKYQKAAEQYAGDFTGGSGGMMSLGGSPTVPIVVGLVALAGGAWYWKNRRS